MNIINNLLFFLFMLVPVFLITGPAIPDIVITLSSLFFLINFIFFKNDYDFLKDKFFLISIIFWFSLLFISFFAFSKMKSFQDSLIFIRLLMIPTIAYFLLLNNEVKIKKTITIIFICVVFVLIDTLFQYFNYNSELGFQNDIFGFKPNWYGRLTGPFGNELVPGAYLSKFSLFGYLFFFFMKNFKFKSLLEILYLSSVGFVCFASGERMALATFFLALFFLLIFLKNKRYIFSFSILLSIFFIIIAINIHPFYNDYKVINSTHYHQGLTVEKYFKCGENKSEECKKIINLQPDFFEILKNFNSSAYGEIYRVGLSMFRDNPLTGIGINNYQINCIKNSKYKKIMTNYDCASHPHNTYIQWLSEGGIIVFLSFTIMLLSIFFYLINGCNQKIFKYVSIACMIILFWPIMSTGSLIKNWNGVLTFYIIGLCLCLNRIRINL